MKAVIAGICVAVLAIGIVSSQHESGQQPKGQIRVVTENGITCAKNNNWSGQTCWREKE